MAHWFPRYWANKSINTNIATILLVTIYDNNDEISVHIGNTTPPAMANSNPVYSLMFSAGLCEIFALLPLLSSEEKEHHPGSALNHGFLFTATAPLSIFGILELAKVGLKAILARTVIS